MALVVPGVTEGGAPLVPDRVRVNLDCTSCRATLATTPLHLRQVGTGQAAPSSAMLQEAPCSRWQGHSGVRNCLAWW